MINENEPAVDDGTLGAQHAPEPTVAAEGTHAHTEAATESATPSEPTEHDEGTAHSPSPSSETEGEEELVAPKTAKKPRKSKAAAATSETAENAESTSPSVAPASETAADPAKKWYVVKVQSGREDSIKAAIERKVKIEGLEEFFGQIAIPVEEIVQKKSVRVTDKKTGDKVTQEKKVIKHQKKFPGYIFAEVEYNDRILYLFRETSGVGDFVNASLHRAPTPMTDREVRSMLTGVAEGDPGKGGAKQKVKLDYEKGDKVKIRDGAFANMEGIVKSITDTKDTGETPKVEVEVHIFGRPVQVVLDYWHVDKA
jgi:transcriptional antiterminator NusG